MEGSIWGLLLFVLVVAAFVAWKTGALGRLRANVKAAIDNHRNP